MPSTFESTLPVSFFQHVYNAVNGTEGGNLELHPEVKINVI